MGLNFQLALLGPELFQFLVVIILFVMTIVPGVAASAGRFASIVAGFGVLVSLGSLGAEGVAFYGAYQVDGVAQFFKAAVAIGFFVACLNAVRQPELTREKEPDYYMLLAISAWGLMLLASCVELVTMFVALEISSYSLYALVPLRGKSRMAAEAGIKYILFGAAATAVSLYGLGFILAGAESSYLAMLATKDFTLAASPMAVAGLTLFLAGFLYKLALFPFHFWCPDVYEGASNETAAYIATLPKLGAVVVLVRLAVLFSPGDAITTIIAILGAVSMTWGNLAALAQRDVKRILGYSSVAHAGYVTLGLVAANPEGLAAAAFYSLVYLLMNLACFWVLCRLAPSGKNLDLDGLAGLYKRAPGLALVLAVSAFALVGLPPTAGFMGKLFLLTSVWNQGYNWLVIVAVVNTAIAIFYYLNLVRYAYTKEPGEAAEEVSGGVGSVVMGGALAVAILVLGIAPAPVMDLAFTASELLGP
jgi:NADH-quinone oxidoreductase subunit N